MEKEYLDYEGLGRVSEYVNAKEPQIFKGTSAEWDALTAAEQAQYSVKMITDDSETGEVVDSVTDGDMRAVTSNAVYNAYPILETVHLESLSVSANSMTILSLSDYNINVHAKPWIAFIWNRSLITNLTLIGDGGNSLLIYNNTSDDMQGAVDIAFLYYPSGRKK